MWSPRSRAHYWNRAAANVLRPPHGRETTLATLAYRLLTVLLSVLAVIGQVAYLDVLHGDTLGLGALPREGGLHPALLSAVITGAVVSTVAGVVALTLAFRGPGDRGARPLGLALAGWAYLLAYSGLTVLLSPDVGSPWHASFDVHFLLVEAAALAGLLRFTTLFPSRMAPGDLQDPETLPVGLRSLQRFRQWLLGPRGPWLGAVGAAFILLGVNAALGRPAEDAALLLPADLLRLGVLGIVILNMRRAFVLADVAGRRQMFWLVMGFTLLLAAVGVLLGGNVLTAVTGWAIPGFNWRPVVLDLGVIGLIWGAAMGVFYGGAMKPGKLSRRLAVLASAVTLALFLAAGMESLLAGAVASRIALPAGTGTLVSLVAVGLLYARTRRPVESMIYHAWAPPPGEP
ncbi:MAG: hypothetical protein AMXMBFR53_18400 [Gemmatimonadota bacterium]